MLSLSVAERSEGKWEPGMVETSLNGSSSLMPDGIARGTFRYRNPRAVQPRNLPLSLPGRPQCSPEPCNTGISIVPAASPRHNGFTAYLQVQAGAPLFTAMIASSVRCNPDNDLPEFF